MTSHNHLYALRINLLKLLAYVYFGEKYVDTQSVAIVPTCG